jgi:hypothetical protein
MLRGTSMLAHIFFHGLLLCFLLQLIFDNIFVIFGSALVRSMVEILFLCGSNERAVIATLSILGNGIQHSEEISRNEVLDCSINANNLGNTLVINGIEIPIFLLLSSEVLF